MSIIDISRLDKAEVLAALYNASKPQGIGHFRHSPNSMTKDEASAFLGLNNYFDYIAGRVMKVDMGGAMLSTALYDRDNGTGAAERALQPLFDKLGTSSV